MWSHVPECFFEPWISAKSVLVSSVAKHTFKKFVKFTFNSHSNFTPPISRGNKVFWFPALIFSTTLPLFKRELPENARFRCQFKPLRAQNTKKNSKKINKNLNDLKLIFLELAHLGLYSSKVWENQFFSVLHDLSWSLQQTALKRISARNFPK